MDKIFLTLDKKVFYNVVDIIYSKYIKTNPNGVYMCGAILNCIFCFFSIEKNKKLKKEAEAIYNKIKEQNIEDNRNNTCKIKTPLICDKNMVEFIFTNKSDICHNYLPSYLVDADLHDKYAYYQVSGISSTEKVKYKDLPPAIKKIIKKRAIPNIDKVDVIAEFYISLFNILQLNPNSFCDYIRCFEMLFFVLDNECVFCENITETMKKEAVNVFNHRTKYEYDNNENEYFVYNIFIRAMNNLGEEIIFKINKFRQHQLL